jgi:hypothetical protein
MDIEELRKERASAYKRMKAHYLLMQRSRNIFQHFEKLYLEDQAAWQRIDRQLATLDGRFKIEPPSMTSKKRAKEEERALPDLTEEQVVNLCNKFGIKLEDIQDDTHFIDEPPDEEE